MRKVIIIVGVLVMLITAHVVFAQTETVITYESRMNMWLRIPPERESMKQMIPEYMTRKAELFTNGAESMYKPVIEEEEDAVVGTGPGGGGGMRMRMRGPETEVYVNYNDQIRKSQQEFMGKKYLITDTIKITPWKFGTETREIAGYTCKQAYYISEEPKQEVVAWYTDLLGMFIGPDGYGSLPGVILAVDINNGERTIVAQKVEKKKLGKNDIKVPSGGTPISGSEFRAMVQEEMKKRGATGSGGTFIIRN
jgi:GLPGLI family protein